MEEDTLYDKVTLPYTDMAPKGGETPFFLLLLLLFFLPPAGWYVIWKERSYHVWFAYLVAFYSLLAIIGSIVIREIFKPQIETIYQQLHIAQPALDPFAYLSVYILLGSFELVIAAILFLIIRRYKVLPKNWAIIAIITLTCNSMIQPISLIYTTYASLHSIYEQNKIIPKPQPEPTPTITPTPDVTKAVPSTVEQKTSTSSGANDMTGDNR